MGPERERRVIEGALDVHVHAAPSLFPRWGDVLTTARAASDAGMGGLVIKAHHGSSVEAAAVAVGAGTGVDVHGGIVLNHGVGGINPVAVDTAVALGARIVWLPTLHARAHRDVFGGLGQFDFQSSAAHAAVTAIDSCRGGRLVPAVIDVLDIARAGNVPVATGHLSGQEILALSDFVQREGWDVRVLVNHVAFRVPDLAPSVLATLAERGHWLELCAFTTTALGGGRAVPEIAAMMVQLSDARWVVASDGGQTGNPPPPDMLRTFARALMGAGVPERRLRQAVTDEPRELLGV